MLKRHVNSTKEETSQMVADVENFNNAFKAQLGVKTKLEEKKVMPKQIKMVGRKEALQMKDLFTAGVKQQEIAKKFADMGFTTRKGTPIKGCNVSWIITNKAKGRRPGKVRATTVKKTDKGVALEMLLKSLTISEKIEMVKALVNG